MPKLAFFIVKIAKSIEISTFSKNKSIEKSATIVIMGLRNAGHYQRRFI